MLGRLFQRFKPHSKAILFGTFCAVIAGATSAAPVALVKVLVDGVLSGTAIPELEHLARFGLHLNPTLAGGQENLLKWCVISVVVIYIVHAFAQFFQIVTLRSVGLRVVQTLRSDLFKKFQRVSLDYFSRKKTGDLMSRVTTDTQLVEGTVSNLIEMFREPLTLIFLVGIAIWMNPGLAIAALVGLPLIAISVKALSKAMRRYARRTRGHFGELSSILQESIAGALIVRAFGLESREVERFENTHDAVLKQSLKAARASAAAGPIVIVLGAIGAAVVLWFGGQQVLRGTVTPGDLMAFIVASMAAYDPIRKLAKTHNQLQQVFAAGERIFTVLDALPSVIDEGSVSAPSEIQEIQFRGVHFSYGSEGSVLKNVSFEAKYGQVIAIVGESGAGKTTLLNLIPRFYDVTDGSVLLNGSDVREFTLSSLRKQVAVVTQETFLFNQSVECNIRHGREDATHDEVVASAQAANAHSFIESLPQGYDTILGERGARLSGGQRQRIAIARAILRDSPILLLDEATSSLDSDSEKEVQKALDGLMHERTTFVIAHRLSTVRNADCILVLSKGRIAEMGTHSKLIGSDGEYRRLYSIQFEGLSHPEPTRENTTPESDTLI